MKATLRRYLRAAGSILELAPTTDYTTTIKKSTSNDALRNDFRRIGGDFNRAISLANASKPAK